jgi:hypothetical protein
LKTFFERELKKENANYLSIEKFKWVILTLFVVNGILYEPIAGEYDNPRAPLPGR